MARIEVSTLIAAALARSFDLARDIDFHTFDDAHLRAAVAGAASGLILAGVRRLNWDRARTIKAEAERIA